jgi:hypothetical protein
MGNIGDAMPGSIPAIGTAGPTYASNLDTFLTEVKARLEEKMPFTSLQPSTLDLSNHPVTNVQYLGLYAAGGTPSTPSNSLQQYSGDLYWVSPGGAVQITAGTALNASSVAGITGDYGGANPAQLRYITANTEYTAYTNFGAGTYAYLWGLGFDIAGATTGSNRVRLLNSGANYSLTVPTALPGAQQTLYLGSTGQMSTSDTRVYTKVIPGAEVQITGNDTHGDYKITSGTSGAASWPISLDIGAVITGWKLYIKKVTNASVTVSANLRKVIQDTVTDQTVQNNSTNAGGFATLSQTGLSLTVAATEQYQVLYFMTGGTGGDFLYQAEVTYTKPW